MVLGLGRVAVENYQGSPLHCGCVFWGLVRHCYLAGCKTCRFVEESFEKAPATRRLGVASLLGTHHGYRGKVVRIGVSTGSLWFVLGRVGGHRGSVWVSGCVDRGSVGDL